VKKKILVVFGTRPEAIKMAPLIIALSDDSRFDLKVCVTAQHRHMLDQVLELFKIKPDFDLNIMRSQQTLNEITSAVIIGLKPILELVKPDIVLVHGDTSTTFAAALAAYYKKIKVGHVEAGLRTKNIYSPWPEEANRKLTSVIANYHFAPTIESKENLISEGVKDSDIVITGNTIVDAVFLARKKLYKNKALMQSIERNFNFLNPDKKLLLVTGHRRENIGYGFKEVCKGIGRFAEMHKQVQIVYSVHLNPNVRKPVKQYLNNFDNIYLIDPVDYSHFCYLMDKAWVILTDSGGIQEEAPSFRKPVLVTRNITERPEAVKAGLAKLVGTDSELIVGSLNLLLTDLSEYKKMTSADNPFGNGHACDLIINKLI